jgi:hypothetical protein
MQLSPLAVAGRILVERTTIAEFATSITTGQVQIRSRALLVRLEAKSNKAKHWLKITYFLSVILARFTARSARKGVELRIGSHFARLRAKNSRGGSRSTRVAELCGGPWPWEQKMLLKSRRRCRHAMLNSISCIIYLHRDKS